MQTSATHRSTWHRYQNVLLILTIVTSAVHFADNAFRLDLYPGPPWLTRNIILATWLLIPAAALLAYWRNTRSALIAYALLGLAGFAHFLMPHAMQMPLRCTATISAEAAASLALIVFSLLRPVEQIKINA